MEGIPDDQKEGYEQPGRRPAAPASAEGLVGEHGLFSGEVEGARERGEGEMKERRHIGYIDEDAELAKEGPFRGGKRRRKSKSSKKKKKSRRKSKKKSGGKKRRKSKKKSRGKKRRKSRKKSGGKKRRRSHKKK